MLALAEQIGSKTGSTKRIARRSGLKGLERSEDGSVAVPFALILTSMILLIGGAVDFGRWLNARDQTIDAIDAAILAAGRAHQTGSTDAAAAAIGKKVYLANVKNRIKVDSDTIVFQVVDNGARITTAGKVTVKTPFLHFARIPSLPLFSSDEAPEATTAQNLGRQQNREVSLMLDVSGSMCSPCDKRDAMKAGAKDLIDILMQYNSQGNFKSKVALVPFSGDVRPPTALFTSLAKAGLPASFTDSISGNTVKKSSCVGERGGTDRYKDTLPVAGDIPVEYTSGGSCAINSADTIIPLSLDNTTLKAKVDALQTGGTTAGHVGTAWAYYLLSPNWAPLLGTSAPSAYGLQDTKKIAVLMTDGEYNAEQSYAQSQTTTTYSCPTKKNPSKMCTQYIYTPVAGASVAAADSGSSINATASPTQAVNICTKMKESGIEVYTIGYDLGGNQTAINTLHDCATDSSHAYVAESTEALKAAFRDIGVKVTDLYVSR